MEGSEQNHWHLASAELAASKEKRYQMKSDVVPLKALQCIIPSSNISLYHLEPLTFVGDELGSF